MTDDYVQVRPVTWERGGASLTRAFDGDPVVAWGVYLTEDGLPMHRLDRSDRWSAVAEAKQMAWRIGCPLYVDELDGTTTEVDVTGAAPLSERTSAELRLDLAEAEQAPARSQRAIWLKRDRISNILIELLKRGAY